MPGILKYIVSVSDGYQTLSLFFLSNAMHPTKSRGPTVDEKPGEEPLSAPKGHVKIPCFHIREKTLLECQQTTMSLIFSFKWVD